MLALMKKKAEAEARESLQSTADASGADLAPSSASVPDDAKELIAAMQGTGAVDATQSDLSLKAVQTQKSRARRLTSTAVVLDDVPQPQSSSARESSGDLLVREGGRLNAACCTCSY
jgi:hypothetical protein